MSDWSRDFILQPENTGWLPVPLLSCPEPSLSSCCYTSCVLLQAQELLKRTKTMNKDNRVEYKLPCPQHFNLSFSTYLLLQNDLSLSLSIQCTIHIWNTLKSPEGRKDLPQIQPSPNSSYFPETLMCQPFWTSELCLTSKLIQMHVTAAWGRLECVVTAGEEWQPNCLLWWSAGRLPTGPWPMPWAGSQWSGLGSQRI